MTTQAAAAPRTDEETRERIRRVLKESIESIGDFVDTPGFQGMLDELYDLPVEERPQFVVDVVLSEEERARRGIEVPEDMIVQRSQFADGRPTLFCVTKKTPLAKPWQKVTVTFDS